jgi:hypothetical protein
VFAAPATLGATHRAIAATTRMSARMDMS